MPALVKDFITPIIALILNLLGLGNLATVKTTFSSQGFLHGDFLTAMIAFIIVALVVFLLVEVTERWGIE